MRPTSSLRSAPMRRWARGVALVVILVGTLLFALAPRVASAAPMQGMRMQVGAAPMHGMRLQVGDDPSMAPHAPVEVQVSPELEKVLEGLLCQCGCNLDAYQCQQTMTCDVSTAMWDQATLMVDREGKTPEQAFETFAVDYGEYVLAQPPKRGFNLVAWGLPLTVLGVGAVILVVALRRWRPTALAPSADGAPQVEPRYLDQLERELREES